MVALFDKIAAYVQGEYFINRMTGAFIGIFVTAVVFIAYVVVKSIRSKKKTK